MDPSCLIDRADALLRKGDLESARLLYLQSIEAAGETAESCAGLGAVECMLGNFKEAVEYFTRALAHRPDCVPEYGNLGSALMLDGRYDEARSAFQKCIDLNPDYAPAFVNLGYLSLLRGDFEKGWADFEWRLNLPGAQVHEQDFRRPFWRGEPLNNDTILLYGEQGFGDTIQFSRYVPLVTARGGRVILKVQSELERLFTGLRGVERVTSKDSSPSSYSWRCPLPSLPFLFNSTLATIPPPLSGLNTTSSVDFDQRFEFDSEHLHVGLVWAGEPKLSRDRHRSLALTQFTRLLDIEGVRFFSLQKGQASAQRSELPPNLRPRDIGRHCLDFADTAAAIKRLDLVITVDTSVAHLAATLNTPTWLLVSYVPDWRWLLGRSDSPWYPSIKIFRQTSPGHWTPILEILRRELQSLRASFHRSSFNGAA